MSWMRDATEPTGNELEALVRLTPGLADLARDATEPLPDELLAVRPATAARPVRWRPAALAVAVALVLLGWLALPDAMPPPFTTTGDAAFTASDDGTSIRVLQADGARTYDVLPVRPSGTFSVWVRDVRVTVLGTRFTVTLDGPEVTVGVDEGRVLVEHPWGRDVLVSGDLWSRAAARPPMQLAAAGPLVRPERDEVGEPVPVLRPVPPKPAAPAPAPATEATEPAEPVVASLPPARRFAALLGRVESGERTSALLSDLAAFMESGPPDALRHEAEVVALLVGAETWPARAALNALDAWLAQNPRHPDQIRVLVARGDVAAERLGLCELAVPTWERIAEGATGEVARTARARADLCLSAMEWRP